MAIRVLAVGNNNTTQEDHRALITALTASAGAVTHRSGLFPTFASANLSNVSAMVAGVGPFKAVVDNPSGSEYLVQSDSAINLTFDPGEAAVTRTDRIIVRVYNNAQDGSGLNEAVVEYLKGQTSGSASPLPSGALLLWEIPVPAGASSGGGGINFTSVAVDRRVYTTSAGGVIPVQSTPDLNGISNAYDGMAAYVRATEMLYVYDGTLWRPKGQINVANSAGLSNVLNPEHGTLAVTRDSDLIYIYNGSSWNKYIDPPLAVLRQTTAQSISNDTFTSMQFQTEDVDTHNGHNPSSNSNRYTCQKAGWYLLSGGVAWSPNTTGRRWSKWRKNGADIPGSGANENATTSGQGLSDVREAAVYMNVGDWIELQVSQDSGGSLNTYVGVEYAQSAIIVRWLRD